MKTGTVLKDSKLDCRVWLMATTFLMTTNLKSDRR